MKKVDQIRVEAKLLAMNADTIANRERWMPAWAAGMLLNLAPAYVSALARRGSIPAEKIDRHWLFSIPELTEWDRARPEGRRNLEYPPDAGSSRAHATQNPKYPPPGTK